MSTEQLTSQLVVTKFDITERLRPNWPHHFHYEARQLGVEFPVGYVSVRHWLEAQRAEINEISVDNSGEYGSGNTVAIGQFMLKACAHNLQLEGLQEIRVPEPNGTEFALINDVFGEGNFAATTLYRDLWPEPSQRQLIQLPADELLARCLREQDQQEPTDEAMELWVPLNSGVVAEWPAAEVYGQPVYL